MRNILIIGNGFDLAHDSPTDYRSFIDNLILKELDKADSKLLKKFNPRPLNEIMNKVTNERSIKYHSLDKRKYQILTNNYFLADLLERKSNGENDWSNIEAYYYDKLIHTENTEIERLQNDFEEIKQYLVKYLISLSSPTKPIVNLDYFFSHRYFNNTDDNLILNFNYTSTLGDLYINRINKFKIKHVHGSLNNLNNEPIIFGYDMSRSEYKKYLREKSIDFFKNIKLCIYKLYSNLEELDLFLSKRNYFNVFIFGHSCSNSDNQMLFKIFDNNSLNMVAPFYYKDVASFRKQRHNID